VFKNQLIVLITLRDEALGVTLPEVKIANNRYCFSSTVTSGSLKAYQRASQFAYRLVCSFVCMI